MIRSVTKMVGDGYCIIRRGPLGYGDFFLAGTVVAAVGLSAAIVAGINCGLWGAESLQTLTRTTKGCCEEQHVWRPEELDRLDQEIEGSQTRQESLRKAVTDPSSRHFALAREKIAEEQLHQKRLSKERSDIQGRVLTAKSAIETVLPVISVILTAFVAAHLMLCHSEQAFLCGRTISGWGRPYWTFVGLQFLVHFGRELCSSVFAKEKALFGWQSFCICPEAWLLTQVMFLGLSMVIAYPVTIVWVLGRSTYRRRIPLNVDHPDGAWGVGDYVLFLQTWSIMCVVFFLFPTLLYLRIWFDKGWIPFIYVVPSMVYSAVGAVIVGRLIWAGMNIRWEYQRKLKKLGKTWSEIQRREPPGDPTVAFLGDHWWQLPATIFGVLATFWLIVTWSGVIELLR